MTGKKAATNRRRTRRIEKHLARPVDRAMVQERPEKLVMRKLWCEVATIADPLARQQNVPLYLTLSGAEGLDIQMLVDRRIIQTTETGAISTESLDRVIAVEHNKEASLFLNRKFPGLTIREVTFGNLLHGPNPIRFPTGKDEDYCRAIVVNIDINEPLIALENGVDVEFPHMTWVRKLSQIHAVAPRINWYLCLTLHGEITLSDRVCRLIQNFLAENFRDDAGFAEAARQFLGPEIVEAIASPESVSFAQLSGELQQKTLMLFIPKKISSLVNADGWKVTTEKNVRYGGIEGRAPMVSWILKFSSDPETVGRPRQLYRESLSTILQSPIWIDKFGSIRR